MEAGAWGAAGWTKRALMEEGLRGLFGGAERGDEPRSTGPRDGGELISPDANLNKSPLLVITNLPPSLGST